jgi:hypothetical protein
MDRLQPPVLIVQRDEREVSLQLAGWLRGSAGVEEGPDVHGVWWSFRRLLEPSLENRAYMEEPTAEALRGKLNLFLLIRYLDRIYFPSNGIVEDFFFASFPLSGSLPMSLEGASVGRAPFPSFPLSSPVEHGGHSHGTASTF